MQWQHQPAIFFAKPFRSQFLQSPGRPPIKWSRWLAMFDDWMEASRQHRRLPPGKLLFSVRRSVRKARGYITHWRRKPAKRIRSSSNGWSVILAVPQVSFSTMCCLRGNSSVRVSRLFSTHRRREKWHGNATCRQLSLRSVSWTSLWPAVRKCEYANGCCRSLVP